MQNFTAGWISSLVQTVACSLPMIAGIYVSYFLSKVEEEQMTRFRRAGPWFIIGTLLLIFSCCANGLTGFSRGGSPSLQPVISPGGSGGIWTWGSQDQGGSSNSSDSGNWGSGDSGSSDLPSDSGSWDSGGGGGDSGSWDGGSWDSGGSDSGSWDSGGGGGDSGSWDSGGSDSGSW
jgi:hypothetical protein